jgi:hypothetical protein
MEQKATDLTQLGRSKATTCKERLAPALEMVQRRLGGFKIISFKGVFEDEWIQLLLHGGRRSTVCTNRCQSQSKDFILHQPDECFEEYPSSDRRRDGDPSSSSVRSVHSISSITQVLRPGKE